MFALNSQQNWNITGFTADMRENSTAGWGHVPLIISFPHRCLQGLDFDVTTNVQFTKLLKEPCATHQQKGINIWSSISLMWTFFLTHIKEIKTWQRATVLKQMAYFSILQCNLLVLELTYNLWKNYTLFPLSVLFLTIYNLSAL